jgi:HD-GYP domain-containing protein (c-di-GMP phosphodiesterase class II)
MSEETGSLPMASDYFPVDIELLRPEVKSPFRLYLLAGTNYVPYSQEGEVFSEATRRKLEEQEVRSLHIREEDKSALRRYIYQNLQALLDDPSLSEQEKSRVVYDTCIFQIERLWVAPAARNIEESKGIFRQAVDHIISSNRDAVRDMIMMLSHETSIYTHCVNVGLLGTSLVREIYREGDRDLHEIGYAMFLHDIGKTEISHEVLNKPGPLTDEEWQIMRMHPERGHQILQREGHLTEQAAATTLQHHERCNGKGYPRSCKSHEIDPLGKICNLVDSYDALLAERVYKPALTPYQALKIMKEEMREQFDQQMFKEFLYILY